jgi:hypothetical protein
MAETRINFHRTASTSTVGGIAQNVLLQILLNLRKGGGRWAEGKNLKSQ